ncbi:hypothetical protein ACTXT7_015389, partial [Hymenolepis weldensis]
MYANTHLEPMSSIMEPPQWGTRILINAFREEIKRMEITGPVLLLVVFPQMSSKHTSSKHEMYFHKRLRVEVEKRISHRETSYALSPRMLRKITYGSLQNIVKAQEQERKGVVEVIDLTGDSDSMNQDQFRNRASSTPREVFPPAIPRSATISVGSTSIISKARLLGNKETSVKTPAPIPLVTAPALQRFFSLKSLSESLPMLISRPPLGTARRSTDVNEGVGSGDVPPAQPRRAVTRIDPKRLDELITWKNMEIATVQNILKANLEKAKDSVICKKSRKAYRDSAQENQKT